MVRDPLLGFPIEYCISFVAVDEESFQEVVAGSEDGVSVSDDYEFEAGS